MPKSNLNLKEFQVNDGLDSIVIISCLGDIPGGRTLDVSGVAAGTEYIASGHILVKDNTTGAFSPLGITDGAYVVCPAGKTIAGVNKYTVSVKDARVGILTQGQVNQAASPAKVNDEIRKALPGINFLY